MKKIFSLHFVTSKFLWRDYILPKWNKDKKESIV